MSQTWMIPFQSLFQAWMRLLQTYIPVITVESVLRKATRQLCEPINPHRPQLPCERKLPFRVHASSEDASWRGKWFPVERRCSIEANETLLTTTVQSSISKFLDLHVSQHSMLQILTSLGGRPQDHLRTEVMIM